MKEFNIEFFETTNGKKPVIDFFESVDIKTLAKILKMVKMLETNGNELREPYTKCLEDGIFELRVKQGNNNFRVLYFFYVGRKIILTNGFIKKTQKTPQNELILAKKYKTEYESRKENERYE